MTSVEPALGSSPESGTTEAGPEQGSLPRGGTPDSSFEVDLVSTLLLLRVVQPGSVPFTNGDLLYAAFLDLIRLHRPELSARLKEGVQTRAFTVSGLLGDFVSVRGRISLERGALVGLRVTALEAGLASLLMDWEHAPPGAIRIGKSAGKVDLAVEAVLGEAHDHPLVRRSGYARLSATVDPQGAASKWRLLVDSPSTFGSRGGNLPLPLPHMVYRTLWRRWRERAPESARSVVATGLCDAMGVSCGLGQHDDIDPAAWPGLDGVVRVESFDIRSTMLHFRGGGGQRVGFSGVVTFSLPRSHRTQQVSRALSILSSFAFFAGVGGHTAVGMGQVSEVRFLVEPRRASP